MPNQKKKGKLGNKDGHISDEDEDNASIASSGKANPSSPKTTGTPEIHGADIMQKLDMIQRGLDRKIDGVLAAIEEVKTDVRNFSHRMDEAKRRIGDMEDSQAAGKASYKELTEQVNFLNNKVEDLEN